MKKKQPYYYLLKICSSDLVFYSFEERHNNKQKALEQLETYKRKYKIQYASVRRCTDIVEYKS
jgi:hypothetical protein